MKNPVIFGAIMLVLGIAIGWVVKPDSDSGKASVAVVSPITSGAPAPPRPATHSSADSAMPSKRATRPAAQAKPESTELSPELMEQARDMQAQMTKKMVDQQRQKFARQIDRLTENLSLTGDQKSKLTAWLDERLKGLEDSDFSDPESAQIFMEESKLLTDEALQAQLDGTLTPEQVVALTDYQNRERASKVDAIALKSLSNLQGIIQFEEGQRDEVYKILSADAEERLASESKTLDISSMFTEGMGIEMDPYGLGIQQAMTEAMSDPAKLEESSEPQSMVKTIRRIIAERIDAKVENLRPVLSDKQLEAYRAELETKGIGVYGNVLDSMDKAADQIPSK